MPKTAYTSLLDRDDLSADEAAVLALYKYDVPNPSSLNSSSISFPSTATRLSRRHQPRLLTRVAQGDQRASVGRRDRIEESCGPTHVSVDRRAVALILGDAPQDERAPAGAIEMAQSPKTLRSPNNLIGVTTRPATKAEGQAFAQLGSNETLIAFLRSWAMAQSRMTRRIRLNTRKSSKRAALPTAPILPHACSNGSTE